MDRETLLITKPPKEKNLSMVPFLTTFSTQHHSVKQLVRKHWHILKNDSILGPALPSVPQVIFRGVSALRHRLAPNVIEPPPPRMTFLDSYTGFYQYRNCRVCSLNGCTHRRTHVFTSTSTSEEHKIKPFITCSTEGIVYLLQCPCGLQYIGRTKRPLSVRLNEHITNILNGFANHSVSKHYLLSHNKDPSKTFFGGLTNIPHTGGGVLWLGVFQDLKWLGSIRLNATSLMD